MRRHWQKKARLIRQAVPGFAGIVSKKQLFALAGRDDVESRVVIRGGTAKKPLWTLEHGPFRPRDFHALPATGWTLLVQGVDVHVEAASDLLQRFDFIPYARLDDLMISYATPGGGVGPHFDSYDVFLLQGPGSRRWQTSTRRTSRCIRTCRSRSCGTSAPPTDAILETRRHALPAAGRRPRRHCRDRVHDVFDRVPRADRRGNDRGISPVPARRAATRAATLTPTRTAGPPRARAASTPRRSGAWRRC